MESVSPGPLRSRHQGRIKGFILLGEMPVRKEIEKVPERVREPALIL